MANQSLRQTAVTWFLAATIIYGLSVIALIWLLPMYICYKNALHDNKSHIWLAIFSMIFAFPLGIVAGVFLLISGGE
ncbi:MAG: hypothetical protein LBC33_01550 [Mycoplasmataceae bacterium]|nr:hypothetical protein [Mycoplasmataceae bacterium]